MHGCAVSRSSSLLRITPPNLSTPHTRKDPPPISGTGQHVQKKSPSRRQAERGFTQKVCTMYSPEPHGNQAAFAPKARRFRDQLTLLTAVTHLEDIADDLSQGQTVKALHAVRELAEWALDTAREGIADHASLAAYRPIHDLDAALHRVRRSVLEKRANAERWTFVWSGETFTASDAETGFLLVVDPADNWRIAVDGPDLQAADSGLSTLIAALNNSTLSEEVSQLSCWLTRVEGQRNA